jgi:hypothetical protein
MPKPIIRRSCGPWNPQLNDPAIGRGSFLAPSGPSILDTACKESLEHLLKPGNLGMIVPWMKSATPQEKRDVVTLGKIVAEADAHMDTPAKAQASSAQEVITNRQGRTRLANTVPVSADRAQQDLLRNRHGADQRNPEIQRRRDFFASFAPVPSTSSVADFYSMSRAPILGDDATKCLDEKVRKKLERWQVRGPEKDQRRAEAAARAVRSLRSVSSAVASVPNYLDHAGKWTAMNSVNSIGSKRGLSGQAHATALYEYSKVQPHNHADRVIESLGAQQEKTLQQQSQLHHARSAPALIRREALADGSALDVDQLCSGPIGYFEGSQLQMRKIRERSIRSKIPGTGGAGSWSTTYGTLMESGLRSP